MKTLTQARRELNLTQSEVARLINSDQYTIANIELGKTNPRPSTKRRIETALNRLIDWKETLIQGAVRASKDKGVHYYQQIIKTP